MSANIPYMDGMGIVIASGCFFWTLVSNGEASEDDSQEVQYSIVLYCQQSGDFIPLSPPPFRKWWFLLDDDKLRLSTYYKIIVAKDFQGHTSHTKPDLLPEGFRCVSHWGGKICEIFPQWQHISAGDCLRAERQDPNSKVGGMTSAIGKKTLKFLDLL